MTSGSKSGKLVLAVMLLVAAALAAFSVWYRHQATHQALAFWGPEAARRIMSAPRVELLELVASEPGQDSPSIDIAGQHYQVRSRTEITDAKGLLHVRKALLEDLSFDWNAPTGRCQPTWPYAIEFSGSGDSTVVVIDPDCGLTGPAGSDRTAAISPILHGVRTFLRENTESTPPK